MTYGRVAGQTRKSLLILILTKVTSSSWPTNDAPKLAVTVIKMLVSVYRE